MTDKSHSMKLLTITLLLATAAKPAEMTVVCLGPTALTTAIQLPTRAILEGQAVTVTYFTEDSNHSNLKVEPDAVVQQFSATSITESSGMEKYTDDISWEDRGWCRFDTVSAQKKCYGLVAYPLDPHKGYEVLHAELELDSNQFCKAYIRGRVEGAKVPEGAIPRPQTGTRRRS